MTIEERKTLVNSYLGKTVKIKIDRPIGSSHPEYKDLVYPVNYGHLPNVLGGDGEALDVYLIGVNEPVREYICCIIGIAHRENDMEDKLIGAPIERVFYQNEILEAINFQEQYYKTTVQSLYEKSCGAVVYRYNKNKPEYLCLLQKASGAYSVPKGHMEIFETEQETAKREIFEETGITTELNPDFRTQVQYLTFTGKPKLLVLFLAEFNGNLKINNDEIISHRWLDCKQAKNVLPKWYCSVIDSIEKKLTNGENKGK